MTAQKNWEQTLSRVKDRLRTDSPWYPIPAFISFTLVLILSAHLLPGLNPRLGSLGEVLAYQSPPQKEGSIWLGIYAKNQRLIVVTADRQRFEVPLREAGHAGIPELVTYLKKRVKDEVIATGLAMETNLIRSKAVIAMDQTLKYVHLRPILAALGEAKITRYGFETKLVR